LQKKRGTLLQEVVFDFVEDNGLFHDPQFCKSQNERLSASHPFFNFRTFIQAYSLIHFLKQKSPD